MTSAARVTSALLTAAAIATGASASTAARTWTDPQGDVTGTDPAPDIRSVTASQTLDRVVLTVAFDTTGPTYSHTQVEPSYVDATSILLDFDRNGRESEDDFLATHTAVTPKSGALELLGPPGGEPKRSWGLAASANGSAVTMSLPKIALGNPAAIRFRVGVSRAYAGAQTRGGFDSCPAAGTHVAALTPLALTAIRLPAAALRPRAGRILSLSGIRGVTANDKRVTLTRVSATARIGGRTLRPIERGAVSWRIPASARRRTVALRVTAWFGAASRTSTWRLHVH